MKKTITIFSQLVLLAGLQGFFAGATAQTVYKTVDENGNVVFTDRPPATESNQQLEVVSGLDISPTSSSAVATQAAARHKAVVAQEEARQARAAEEAKTAAENQVAQTERAANCASAQDLYKRVTTRGRMYRTVDGERQYLSSEEVETRAKAEQSVNEWCS